ncbi:Protein of unknown function [Cotesia congregata]|uniref:Uncharacterized protein n=1 Tax=Cotesia congregata TaxID=51543 RepID=A0A8J2EHD8_COTCN|nr:Protein of unknown function [Cotesia congregata]
MKRTKALERLEKLTIDLQNFVLSKVDIHTEIKTKTTSVVNALQRIKTLDEDWQATRRLTPRITPEKSSQAVIETEESMDTGADGDGKSIADDKSEGVPKSNKRKDRNSPDPTERRVAKKKDLKPSPLKDATKQNAEKKDAAAWQDLNKFYELGRKDTPVTPRVANRGWRYSLKSGFSSDTKPTFTAYCSADRLVRKIELNGRQIQILKNTAQKANCVPAFVSCIFRHLAALSLVLVLGVGSLGPKAVERWNSQSIFERTTRRISKEAKGLIIIQTEQVVLAKTRSGLPGGAIYRELGDFFHVYTLLFSSLCDKSQIRLFLFSGEIPERGNLFWTRLITFKNSSGELAFEEISRFALTVYKNVYKNALRRGCDYHHNSSSYHQDDNKLYYKIFSVYENSSKVYYYTLFLPENEEQRIGPFPVAEFVSSRHKIPTITDFLNHVVYGLQSLDPHRVPLIDKIETDFSLALLQSCCKVLNVCNLTVYMNKACKDIEKLSRMTVIRICSSHMLNTGRRHFKSLKIQKDELDVAMEAASNLIHCTTVQAAEHVFEVMISINIDKTLLTKEEEEAIEKMPWSTSNYQNSKKTNASKTDNKAVNDSEDRRNYLRHDSESDNDGLSDTSCSSSDDQDDADEETKVTSEKAQQKRNQSEIVYYTTRAESLRFLHCAP